MSARPTIRPVCLIGPPAAGKTTLAEALRRALDAPVIRPRDAIALALDRYPGASCLFPKDERGYVPDESLGFALRVCLEHMEGQVILESLPWNAIQLADLHRVAGDTLSVVCLRASDDLVRSRRVGRRYCRSCYPAVDGTDEPARCSRCGEPLTERPDDQAVNFEERVSAYRVRASSIRALAEVLRVNTVTLDADSSLSDLQSEALAGIRRQRRGAGP